MSKSTRICALFLFNHRFERNLPVLDTVYGKRFSHRHVLMPFASHPGPGVSRVLELGRNFSGHIAQGARDFMRDDFTHYVVIPDDLLLHPTINEDNLLDHFGLAEDEAWITNLMAADALRYTWPHAGEAGATFARFAKTIDLAGLIPPAAEAKARFETMGLTFPERPGPEGTLNRLKAGLKAARQSGWCWLHALTLRGRPSAYPLLSGYSDLLVIPAPAMERFVHYCGVFAALNLFAEVAVPTALALAADKVKTELRLNTHFTGVELQRADPAAKKGVAFWSAEERAPYESVLSGSLEELFAKFPQDVLYFHPVKLSAYL